MSLAANSPIGFIPTANPSMARKFYENTLGLQFESADDFAIVFRVGLAHTMLRVTTTPSFTPTPFTIFGWQVADISLAVTGLADQGVEFLRFDFLEQDAKGIWNAPGGARVAWFKDPDGNTLSLSQHPT